MLGSDEIASAVGCALHGAGYGVVLTDDVDPACPLRSLSYVEAWYFGTAELAGVAACFCSSIKSVPEVIERQKLVAATTWSWQGLARALSPVLLVDTRAANGSFASALSDVPGKPRVIACGAGVRIPGCASVALDPAVGADAFGAGCAGGPATHRRLPWQLDDAAARGWVAAPRDGTFHTGLRPGSDVDMGTIIGQIGAAPVRAGAAGRLAALSLRGARVHEGQLVAVLAIGHRASPLDELAQRAKTIADGVLGALADPRRSPMPCEPVA